METCCHFTEKLSFDGDNGITPPIDELKLDLQLLIHTHRHTHMHDV